MRVAVVLLALAAGIGAGVGLGGGQDRQRPARTVTVTRTPAPVRHKAPDPCAAPYEHPEGVPLRCLHVPVRLVAGHALRNTAAWALVPDVFLVAGGSSISGSEWAVYRHAGTRWKRLYGESARTDPLPTVTQGRTLDGGAAVLVASTQNHACGSHVLLSVTARRVDRLLARHGTCERTLTLGEGTVTELSRVGRCPYFHKPVVCSAGTRTTVRAWIGRREVVRRSHVVCSYRDGDPANACASACRLSMRQVGRAVPARATLEVRNTSRSTCHLDRHPGIDAKPIPGRFLRDFRTAPGRLVGPLPPGATARLSMQTGRGRPCGPVRFVRMSWSSATATTPIRGPLRVCMNGVVGSRP